jgi:hypothetical protein
MSKSEPPVLLLGYNRPELISKRINELVENRVSELYISIDTPLDPESQFRKFLDTIPRILGKSTKVTVMINNSNLGLARHISLRIEELLKIYPAIIVLEDDIRINNNFIAQLVSGYETLNRLNEKGIVSGFSPITNPFRNFSYNRWRITPYFNCWGWLCTKDAWDGYKLNLSDENLAAELKNSLTWKNLSSWQKHLWLSRFKKIQKFPDHTWDIQFQYLCFKKSVYNLSPVFSLTDNEGFNDVRSVHTSGPKPKWWGRGSLYEKLFYKKSSNLVKNVFVKVIEPLTTAGDSQLIRFRNRIKK